jgi:integrase
MHPKQSKLLTTALRSFLRYARYCGKVKLDLGAAVPVVPHWAMTTIPRAIPADQVRQLLNSIDRSTALGRRDYAILLVLARLGLRASEVAFLEFDDINWNATVKHSWQERTTERPTVACRRWRGDRRISEKRPAAEHEPPCLPSG